MIPALNLAVANNAIRQRTMQRPLGPFNPGLLSSAIIAAALTSSLAFAALLLFRTPGDVAFKAKKEVKPSPHGWTGSATLLTWSIILAIGFLCLSLSISHDTSQGNWTSWRHFWLLLILVLPLARAIANWHTEREDEHRRLIKFISSMALFVAGGAAAKASFR